MKKAVDTVWKSQKSESLIKLYNFRWTSAENDIWDTVLWKKKTLSYRATESGSGNSLKKEKNVINWHINNSKSSWFPWSWRYD